MKPASEYSQYQVPRAVQAMNKLLNNDGVVFTIEDGGIPDRWVSLALPILPIAPRLAGWVERSETHRSSRTST